MESIRKWIITLGVFLGVGVLSFLYFQENAPEQASPPSEVATEPQIPRDKKSPDRVSANSPSRHAPPIGKPVVVREKNGSPSENLNGNLVEFQIVGDWAVAYGDVLLGKPDPSRKIKKGVTEVRSPELWHSKEIPYAIARDLPNPERVERALEYFRKHTAVDFVKYTGQKDALVFEVGERHCYSYLGMTGGLQPVKLSGECRWNEIVHEIMHALGFIHEQSRSDRDQYVEVLWENIEETYRPQFAIAPELLTEPLRGTVFDFNSVMLYRDDFFSKKKGLPTLKSKGNAAISPVREGLSSEDIRRVNSLYGLHE